MKAFLDATGQRGNLYPLTARFASPMLPVGNRPVITYAIELLARHRIRDVLVGLYRQADSVEAYCDTGRRWNADFTYLLQREALGTAGAVKRAQILVSDTLLVMPGDALIDISLDALFEFHCEHKAIATAVVAARDGYDTHMPVARFDPGRRVQSIEAAGVSTNAYCFTNAFLLEPEVLEQIPSQAPFDLAADLLPQLLAQDMAVYAFVLPDYWNPLDTFSSYQAAQQDYLRSLNRETAAASGQTLLRHAYVEAAMMGEDVWRGSDVKLHPSVRIDAYSLIGAGAQIGRDVTIGSDVTIGPGCIIDKGASIEASTILPDTYIGKLLRVQNKLVSVATVIDIESQESIELTDRRLLGSAGTHTANALLRAMLERALALTLAIVVMPFVAALGALVWLMDFGPVLVRETCYGSSPKHAASGSGERASPLALYRLRTRLPDGSYTALGRWLERRELHRLPEILNVALGDLALVGVKPLTVEEVNRITEDWQRRRFDCPAGFTGRWYTETEAGSDLYELFVADVYQTAARSTRDLWQQLARTPAAWWRRSIHPSTCTGPADANAMGKDPYLGLLDDGRLK